MGRVGRSERKTKEVNIVMEIWLDDPGENQIFITASHHEPNFGFDALHLFEHLLAQIFKHGKLGGNVDARGDLPHHIVEDLGIVFGQALKAALGDGKGIARFASLEVPFEGSLASVALDISGRGYAVLDFQDMDDKTLAGMFQHFIEGMAINAGLNLYGKVETVGTLRNDHHKLEAFCKALGVCLYRATRVIGTDIPSTKGVL